MCVVVEENVNNKTFANKVLLFLYQIFLDTQSEQSRSSKQSEERKQNTVTHKQKIATAYHEMGWHCWIQVQMGLYNLPILLT